MQGQFVYANPAVIRWGAGSVAGLGADVDRLGGNRVALVTTRSVAGDGELMAAVKAGLAGRDVVATSVVRAHAPEADLDAAATAATEAGADVVVSVGGGSPVDAAKIVALRAGQASGGATLPHVAVPTTLSVAELAAGAGYTDSRGNKAGMWDPSMLPATVVYDASLALRTPLELWLSTGLRAVDHGVEGFLAPGEHPLSDVLAVEGLRRLLRGLPQAKAEPGNAEVRTENQLAAWMTYTLPGPSAMGLSHVMGKQIGARYGIPHGVTSCLLLPHVMRYRARREAARLAALARTLGLGDTAEAAADAVAALVTELGLPRRISAFDVPEAGLREAAETLASSEHAASDLLAVYTAAL